MSLRWRGSEILNIVKQAGMRALHDKAENILTESIDETPVESGTLRRSGRVEDKSNEDAVEISYNTPYAVKQHEDLSLRHTDGKAKFLEDPYNRNKEEVIRHVGNRVRQALRG